MIHNPNKIITIKEVYNEQRVGRMMNVDFLREEEGITHRMMKAFYDDDWDEIKANRKYYVYQENEPVSVVPLVILKGD